MRHVITLPLRVAAGDFETATDTRSDHGKWFVSFGPVYALGLKLQQAVSDVHAPCHADRVSVTFEDHEGMLWAGQEPLLAEAREFWSETWTTAEGEVRPVMPNRRAWTVSRAWLMCRKHSAERHFPELFVMPPTEEILRNIRIQRPSPCQRAFARLHDEFGYPCSLRFAYNTRLDVVEAAVPV